MPIDCLNPPCYPTLPVRMVVDLFGDPAQKDYSDCSLNLLYMVDTQGLIDQFDPNSEVLLSTDNRTARLETVDDVTLHFSRCDMLHWELFNYFNWDQGVLQRPNSILLGYFDSENETMLEALEEIHRCDPCFVNFTHVAYDKDDNPLYDTVDSLDLAEWASVNQRHFAVLPTVDETNLIDPDDEISSAYQAKLNKYDYSAFVLLNDVCIPELDDNCEETGNQINRYDINHLGFAAVLSSKSSLSDDYSFTSKFTPKNNAFDTLATSFLGEQDTRYVTGVNPYLGGIDPLYPHHVNVFHKIGKRKIYIEGVTATGDYVDTILQKIHIQKTLEEALYNLLNEEQYLSISDYSKIQSTMSGTIINLVNQNIITTEFNAYDISSFNENDIFLSGNGWVLLKTDTDFQYTNSRISPTFTFCYIKPGVTHFISFTLCNTKVLEV